MNLLAAMRALDVQPRSLQLLCGNFQHFRLESLLVNFDIDAHSSLTPFQQDYSKSFFIWKGATNMTTKERLAIADEIQKANDKALEEFKRSSATTGYYVRILEYGEPNVSLIDEVAMQQAERGENYLNPDDYMLFGDFSSAEEARQAYADECGSLALEKLLDA